MGFETSVSLDADADIVEQMTERVAQEDMLLANGRHPLQARIARRVRFERCDARDALRRRDQDQLPESLNRQAPDIGAEDLTMLFAVLRQRARLGLRPFGEA